MSIIISFRHHNRQNYRRHYRAHNSKVISHWSNGAYLNYTRASVNRTCKQTTKWKHDELIMTSDCELYNEGKYARWCSFQDRCSIIADEMVFRTRRELPYYIVVVTSVSNLFNPIRCLVDDRDTREIGEINHRWYGIYPVEMFERFSDWCIFFFHVYLNITLLI